MPKALMMIGTVMVLPDKALVEPSEMTVSGTVRIATALLVKA